MVSDERLQTIENLVCDSLNEDATLSKVNFIPLGSIRLKLTSFNNYQTGIGAVNARVYAVKVRYILCSHFRLLTHPIQANRNPLLDVARETYKENIGDIYALHRALCEKHDLPMTLVYQEGGFVFAIKKSDMESIGSLPWGFVNVSMQKGRWLFNTMELVSR